jgi:glycosyltransferase involved in cell wall biosynthesis
MKLVVTIPAYNEEETLAEVIKEIPRELPGISEVKVLVFNDGSRDATADVAREAGADVVFSHKKNKGLAVTFRDALDAAIDLGADIIVNTDADNHYNQSRIGDLIAPIVQGRADIVIGSRKVAELEDMPFLNKYLNQIGSLIMTKWAGMPKYDVSTGFRAYTREAAMKLCIYSQHTYTHTTMLSAEDLKLITVEVPIKARKVSRPSRLIKSVPSHMIKAGGGIVRNIVLFRPLRFFGLLGAIVSAVGFGFVIRFIYLYFTVGGKGHVQSLVLAASLMIIGFQTIVMGLLGSSIGWHRKVTEEVLFRVKQLEQRK